MTCINNVKYLYQAANVIKNNLSNLIEEDKKLKDKALKNEAEIKEIRIQCEKGLKKVN